MRNTSSFWVILGVILIIDIYVFQAVRTITVSASSKQRIIVYSIYWTLSVLTILVFTFLPYLTGIKGIKLARATLFTLPVGLFLAKIIASIFFLTDDIRRTFVWIWQAFNKGVNQGITADAVGDTISRSAFLSWAGVLVGGGLFSTLIYGMNNRYRYQVTKNKLRFSTLPEAFNGLKVVHISDIHSGSFNDKAAVLKGVEKIMKQNPDLILFTGDLVNNVAVEMEDYIEVFKKLNAPMGVYATLGNHDYGDYVAWESKEAKQQNLQQLKNVFDELGWKLLMNEHVVFSKNNEEIALIGIENWSAKARFPKYGNMQKAYEGTEKYPFKILMSHDPSHWKAQVIPSFSSVDLTLSGHTHGMQFGLELPGIKWSPVQYMYKEWAGLYEYENQKLYVNRGFGFLGYPGRVGVLPEITVLELFSDKINS